jgi:tRNA pseudouridine38-40 synthase
MVRALVGTMVEVGQGKISHNNFRKIVECRNRNSAGFSAPGKGLFLHKIVYSDEIQDILLSE